MIFIIHRFYNLEIYIIFYLVFSMWEREGVLGLSIIVLIVRVFDIELYYIFTYIVSNFFSKIISSVSNLIANFDYKKKKKKRKSENRRRDRRKLRRYRSKISDEYMQLLKKRREIDEEVRSPPGIQRRWGEDRMDSREKEKREGQNGEALRDRNRLVGRRPLRSSHTEIHLKSSH